MFKKIMLLALIQIFLLSTITGCTKTPDTPNPNQAGDDVTITVAAASDLRFAFEEIGKLFEEKTGVKVVFSFGSSGNLKKQIEEGGPFDVYASANLSFVTELEEKGFIDPNTSGLYGIGRITLLTMPHAPKLETLEELLDSKIKYVAIANPEHAPYGLAAKEALISKGLWEQLNTKLVYAENISQALKFVETGNAEAGIIALSLAITNKDLNYTLIDEGLHNPLMQAMGVVTASLNKAAAEEFVRFVNGSEGRVIMDKYGFVLPN